MKKKSAVQEQPSPFNAEYYDSRKGDIKVIFQVLKLGKRQWPTLSFGIALILATSYCVMASAKLLGKIIEHIGDKNNTALPYGDMFTLITLETIVILFFYLGTLLLTNATVEIVQSIRKSLFRKITTLPLSYFDKEPEGRIITRLSADVEGMEKFFNENLTRIISSSIRIVAVYIAMLLTDFQFSLLVIGLSLPAILFSLLFKKKIRFWLRELKSRRAMLNARIAEGMNGLKTIKIFFIESWLNKTFGPVAQRLYEAHIMVMNWNIFIRPLTVLLCSLPIVYILYFGGHLYIAGEISLAVFIAFIRYSERFSGPVRTISQEIQVIQEALASSERVISMLDEKGEDLTIYQNGNHTAPIQGKVEFRDYCMSYSRPSRPISRQSNEKLIVQEGSEQSLTNDLALDRINITISHGEKIGIMGTSGSGKTTFVNSIAGLYRKSSGSLLIDDKPLEYWNREHLRSQIGIVTQRIHIFNGSLYDNLIINAGPNCNSNGSRKRFETILEISGAAKLIEKLPQGLNTKIYNRGQNFSSGEKQIISIARVFLQDPQILIFDEATSHLDKTWEDLISGALEKLFQGRTCFIIAHRLETIEKCDKILLIEQGQILEEGSFEELKGAGGRFSEYLKSYELMQQNYGSHNASHHPENH